MTTTTDNITADELLQVADEIGNYGMDVSSFMCIEFKRCFSQSRRTREFNPLLRKHGVNLSGDLIEGESHVFCNEVRFMFLEFLAWERS